MADNRKTGKTSSTQPNGDNGVKMSAKTSTSNPQTVSTSVPEKTAEQLAAENIMAKITNEGQLIRNTGTNSIKSINVRLEKFTDILSSVSKEMQIQTNILKNIQNDALLEHDRLKQKDDREEEIRKIRQSELDEERRNPKNPKEPNIKPPKEKNGSGGLDGLIHGILGGPLSSLISLPFRAIAAAMGGIAANFTADFILQKLENLGIEDQYLDAIAGPLKGGMIWGALGLAISKKMGLVGLVGGGVAWPMADKLLDMAGFDPKQVVMGLELEDIFGAILTGSLMFFGRSVLRPANISKLVAGVSNTVTAGGGITGKMLKTITSGLMSTRLAYLGLANVGIEMAQGAVEGYMENAGIDKETTGHIMDTMQLGATIGGSIGGLHGMLIGAGVGLVVGIGEKLYSWFTDTDRIIAEKTAEADRIMKKMIDDTDYTMNQAEIAHATNTIHTLKEAGLNDEAANLENAVKLSYERQGQDFISPEVTESLFRSLSDNKEDHIRKLNEIANMADDQKGAAYDEFINGIAKDYPDLDPRVISDEIRRKYGSAGMFGGFFSSDERNNIADNLPNMLKKSNIHNSIQFGESGQLLTDEYHKRFMPEFNKAFPNQEFDPKNSEHVSWLSDNPEFLKMFQNMFNASVDKSGSLPQYIDINNSLPRNPDVVTKYDGVIDYNASVKPLEQALSYIHETQKEREIGQYTIGRSITIHGDTNNDFSTIITGQNRNESLIMSSGPHYKGRLGGITGGF